jgi:hypothetical protein
MPNFKTQFSETLFSMLKHEPNIWIALQELKAEKGIFML